METYKVFSPAAANSSSFNGSSQPFVIIAGPMPRSTVIVIPACCRSGLRR